MREREEQFVRRARFLACLDVLERTWLAEHPLTGLKARDPLEVGRLPSKDGRHHEALVNLYRASAVG